VTETDLELSDGRTLHMYDASADDADGQLTAFWHHGTPNIGAPPEPLFAAAARLGIRWASYDRPGYGGSTPYTGRDVASAAAYVSSIADALGIDQFALMGHSGGGSHALACGAQLPERVLGVVSVAGLAPFGAEGLDWFAALRPPTRRNCAPPPRDAQRWRTIWSPPSLTRKCSPRQIMPRSLARGLG
jgi:pimeloyl-ACP methyl ester carboxylesterase